MTFVVAVAGLVLARFGRRRLGLWLMVAPVGAGIFGRGCGIGGWWIGK